MLERLRAFGHVVLHRLYSATNQVILPTQKIAGEQRRSKLLSRHPSSFKITAAAANDDGTVFALGRGRGDGGVRRQGGVTRTSPGLHAQRQSCQLPTLRYSEVKVILHHPVCNVWAVSGSCLALAQADGQAPPTRAGGGLRFVGRSSGDTTTTKTGKRRGEVGANTHLPCNLAWISFAVPIGLAGSLDLRHPPEASSHP